MSGGGGGGGGQFGIVSGSKEWPDILVIQA